MAGGVVIITGGELDGMRSEIERLRQENSELRQGNSRKKVTSFLGSIRVSDVLEESGIEIEILAQMKQVDEAVELIRETDLARVFGRLLFEAVHPQQEGEDETNKGGEKERNNISQVTRSTTRSKFRQVLGDVVGPDAPEKDWKEVEWETIMGARVLSLGFANFQEMIMQNPGYATAGIFCQEYERGSTWALMLAAGYTRDQAQVLCTLRSATVRTAISQAVEEKSSRLALTTHAAYNALAAKASKGEVAPKCYFYLSGQSAGKKTGLADADARWACITEPDVTGFVGMTTHGPIKLRAADESYYSPEGLQDSVGGGKSGGVSFATMDSTVVCFESTPPEDRGRVLHSVVGDGSKTYFLPPLTLLEVVKVQGPGEWEYMPGMRINQSLITVRLTYLLPAQKQKGTKATGKFAADSTFLSYGQTQDAVRGSEDVTSNPVLTMQQEWARDDKWTDWQGKGFSGWREWEYVINPVPHPEDVQRKEGSGVGTRDADRDGFSVQAFVDQVNGHVTAKSETMRLDVAPLLIWAEVVAIRLYTGPAYVPLNNFLREVSKVGPDWRKKLSRMHQLSYSSTVGHLINGLRKLVRVNDEPNTTVYRGIRGELPEAFWLKDAFGMVTATDFAFMSTSVDDGVCVDYMSTQDKNVLWEIRCSEETSQGFHCGADVSLLSQFPTEKEMLFPPLTMLTVQRIEGRKNTGFSSSTEETAPSGAVYTRIIVVPNFI
jgi:hypothetical protein